MEVSVRKKDSILNRDIISLESMDMNYVKKIFIDEIKALENISESSRNKRLQRILTHLFSFQPSFSLNSGNLLPYLNECEQRLYVDLISIPELKNITFFRDFLENDFKTVKKNKDKRRLLIDILNYYDTHSEDVCEKFNYIFRSSDRVSTILLNDDIELEKYFSKRIMDSFDKEDLSRLFRFYFFHFYDRNTLDYLFDDDNFEVLFMMSVMARKFKVETGRSSEFLYSLLNLVLKENFNDLLKEYYYKYVGGKEHEKEFEDKIFNGENFFINDLINYINSYMHDGMILYPDIDDIDNLDEFIKDILKNKVSYHYDVFKKDSLDIGKYDFKDINTYDDLDNFKRSFLYVVYGISLEKAYGIYDYYCQYIDELESDIDEEDKRTLEILKTIVNIVDLELDDRDSLEKINVLQDIYLKFILEKGINYESREESFVFLECLFNKMFINTYNKRLLKSDGLKIISEDDGVLVLDAGKKFNIMLTSLSGANSSFDMNLNMESKWNTAAISNSQGLCLSYITEQNLGVISLESPILGFSYIPESSLEVMGSSDIFSSSDEYCLSFFNSTMNGNNRIYVPASIMGNETRYGYNEILVDRFLMDDKDNVLKLQPDYVVFYKVDDNYKDTNLYRNSVKIAKDFDIPVVIIDVLDVKENEQKEIGKMEEELFSSDECNSQLMNDIIVRYMNNYAGSLTLVGSCDYYSSYKSDFSVEGMVKFLNKVMKKINELDGINGKIEWINAVDHAYQNEKRKYDLISSLSGWNCSVEYFVLKKLGYELRIMLNESMIDNSCSEEIISEEDNKVFPEVILEDGSFCMFVDREDYSVELRTIIDFLQYLSMGTTFNCERTDVFVGRSGFIISCERDKDTDINVIEDLVISYFFNNYDYDFVSELGKYNFKINIEFRGDEEDVEIKKKEVDEDKLFLYLSKISDMSDMVFKDIFHPLIKRYSHGNVDEYEKLLDKMLMKKKNINDMFFNSNNKGLVKNRK